MLELLADIASVPSLIKIDVRRDDAQLKPSFALRRPRRRIPGAFRRIADGS